MLNNLIIFVLYWLPEAYLLITAALSLLGLETNLRKILLNGFFLAIITFISRYFLFNLGLHTPIILAGLIASLSIGFRLTISTAVTGCFLSFFLLLMGESFIMSPILKLTNVSFQDIVINPWMHILFGWISEGFLIIAILICKLGKVTLIKAPESIRD